MTSRSTNEAQSRRGFALTAWAALVATTIGVSLLAYRGAAPSAITFAIAASFVPYLAMLLLAPRAFDPRLALRLAILALIVVGLSLVFAPPVLSDDVFRFAWEGRLWREGFNPYLVPPDHPTLKPLRDPVWHGINNKPLASIYPPLAQALFVLASFLGDGVVPIKLLALGGHVATTLSVARLSDDPRAPLAIALNPLLLSATALDGHLDVLVGLALLACAWGLAHQKVGRAVVATVLAVGLKVVGLVFVPLFVRRPRALVAVLVGSAAFLWPMVVFRPAQDAASGPLQFAERWRGNESLFAVVDWGFGLVAPEETATTLARAICVGAVFALCLGLAIRRVPTLSAARIVLWATLLLSPQVHPWYLAWLLPLEVVSGRFAGLVWSAAALVAYLPLDRWLTDGVWEPSPLLQAAEYGLVAAALVLEHRLRRVAHST
ncbi:MAG: glycosyltransferase 87 family protein [Myxococcota bacterium]